MISNHILSCISEAFIFISVPIYKKTPIAIELKIKSFWKSITIPIPKTKIIDPHHEWELNFT